MSRIGKTKNRRLLCAVTAFLMIWTIASPAVIYAADEPIRISVRQILSAFPSAESESFVYRLRPLGADHPMPLGSTAEGYTFTISGNRVTEISSWRAVRQGVYRYELFPVTGREKPEIVYDRRMYTIEIYVDAELKVYIVVRNGEGEKAGTIVFTHRYTEGGATEPPSPTSPPATAIPPEPPGETSPPAVTLIPPEPSPEPTEPPEPPEGTSPPVPTAVPPEPTPSPEGTEPPEEIVEGGTDEKPPGEVGPGGGF
ncbi:MAG: hypothetical protein FWG93_07765, partial [Oscillospiraceae bacterium]|nr:hypothetical protein [Oscillospiraceae bacterium]